MRKIIEMILALLILGIGVYMFWKYDSPTPPALSGITFTLIGVSLWVPSCPLIDHACLLKK